MERSRFGSEVVWFENMNGSGINWTRHDISVSADRPFSVVASDLDGDGDTDALSALYDADTVAWYANVDGLGGVWVNHTITQTADGAFCVFAIDIDDDGDVDALAASKLDDTIAWHEHADGSSLIRLFRLYLYLFNAPASFHRGPVFCASI